jgi:TfoX/Sxy family transcriptional regulator of competence genes
MARVKIAAEHHPLFLAALPKDGSVETVKMFGGVGAKVNGRMFAGLFGASVMIWLPEDERAEALALKGAAPFDPMGDGRRSDKVMLPERFMHAPAELKRWVTRAFKAAAALPPETKKKKAKKATAASAKAKAKTAKRVR